MKTEDDDDDDENLVYLRNINLNPHSQINYVNKKNEYKLNSANGIAVSYSE